MKDGATLLSGTLRCSIFRYRPIPDPSEVLVVKRIWCRMQPPIMASG